MEGLLTSNCPSGRSQPPSPRSGRSLAAATRDDVHLQRRVLRPPQQLQPLRPLAQLGATDHLLKRRAKQPGKPPNVWKIWIFRVETHEFNGGKTCD